MSVHLSDPWGMSAPPFLPFNTYSIVNFWHITKRDMIGHLLACATIHSMTTSTLPLTSFLCDSWSQSPPDAATCHLYPSMMHSRHCVWQERDDGTGTAVVEAEFWLRTILRTCCWWRWCLCIPQRWCSHGNLRKWLLTSFPRLLMRRKCCVQ